MFDQYVGIAVIVVLLCCMGYDVASIIYRWWHDNNGPPNYGS